MSMRNLLIQGGTSLVQNTAGATNWSTQSITTSGTCIDNIAALQNDALRPHTVFDASGLLVLPGMVDIHGDAFERQVQPRPDTVFSYEIALADTDRQLVANGITTACHGLTYSWEGGLRGRESAIALLEQVARQRKTAHADHRIHLRFENHHVDGLADALQWIQQGRIDILAFNEHLPAIAKKVALPEKLAAYSERARCDAGAYLRRLQKAQARSEQVPHVIATLAQACRTHGVPMASHDDETFLQRERYQELGVMISEFPRTEEALLTAMGLDNQVVMGAPNVLLGGSHCGGLATEYAVRSGMCDMLASDYYYPSMLHAAFKLAHLGLCTLAQAWCLVAQNPARALGLEDRGHIRNGGRADMVLVEVSAAGTARLVATIAAGKLVYCADPARMHMPQAYQLAA